MKPDYGTLVPLFSTAYFKHDRDRNRARDGSESKVLQAILVGRSHQADGYLLYSPYTREFYVSGDCKIDTGNHTATAFNLKYDGGMFLGIYDSSHIFNGTEPYPPGTTAIFTNIEGKLSTGTVTSCPLPEHDQGFPTSSCTKAKYSVKMTDGEIITLSPEALDLVMDSRHEISKSSLPQWLHHNAKIMLFHKNNFHKGWLFYDDETGWEFQIRKRNGDVRFSIKIPNILTHHSGMIETKTILPGWSNSVRQIVATARHVSAKNLVNTTAPGSLRIALIETNPDRPIWLASYIEEIQGLLRMETFDVITAEQYRELIKQYRVKAIP